MLMRFDPFREFDRLMRQPVGGMAQAGVAMDAYRRGDDLVVEVDLPGVDADSIDLTVERDVLEVSAERRAGYRDDDEVLVGERPHGKVVRQLFLGHALDTERISASYDTGVLTITIPVAEEAKPHKVAINSGGQRAVEASAS